MDLSEQAILADGAVSFSGIIPFITHDQAL
jgi:hypothetical protein